MKTNKNSQDEHRSNPIPFRADNAQPDNAADTTGSSSTSSNSPGHGAVSPSTQSLIELSSLTSANGEQSNFVISPHEIVEWIIDEVNPLLVSSFLLLYCNNQARPLVEWSYLHQYNGIGGSAKESAFTTKLNEQHHAGLIPTTLMLLYHTAYFSFEDPNLPNAQKLVDQLNHCRHLIGTLEATPQTHVIQGFLNVMAEHLASSAELGFDTLAAGMTCSIFLPPNLEQTWFGQLSSSFHARIADIDSAQHKDFNRVSLFNNICDKPRVFLDASQEAYLLEYMHTDPNIFAFISLSQEGLTAALNLLEKGHPNKGPMLSTGQASMMKSCKKHVEKTRLKRIEWTPIIQDLLGVGVSLDFLASVWPRMKEENIFSGGIAFAISKGLIKPDQIRDASSREWIKLSSAEAILSHYLGLPLDSEHLLQNLIGEVQSRKLDLPATVPAAAPLFGSGAMEQVFADELILPAGVGVIVATNPNAYTNGQEIPVQTFIQSLAALPNGGTIGHALHLSLDAHNNGHFGFLQASMINGHFHFLFIDPMGTSLQTAIMVANFLYPEGVPSNAHIHMPPNMPNIQVASGIEGSCAIFTSAIAQYYITHGGIVMLNDAAIEEIQDSAAAMLVGHAEDHAISPQPESHHVSPEHTDSPVSPSSPEEPTPTAVSPSTAILSPSVSAAGPPPATLIVGHVIATCGVS